MFGKQRFLKDLKGGRALVKKPLQTQNFLFSKNITEREYPSSSLYWYSIDRRGAYRPLSKHQIQFDKKNLKSLSLLPAFIPVSVVINESQPKIGLSQKVPSSF
jgi:hypothetical protein